MTKSTLFFWNSQALFIGQVNDTAEHQHYALQIGIGLDNPFRVHYSEKWYRHRAAIIASNQSHQFEGLGKLPDPPVQRADRYSDPSLFVMDLLKRGHQSDTRRRLFYHSGPCRWFCRFRPPQPNVQADVRADTH